MWPEWRNRKTRGTQNPLGLVPMWVQLPPPALIIFQDLGLKIQTKTSLVASILDIDQLKKPC